MKSIGSALERQRFRNESAINREIVARSSATNECSQVGAYRKRIKIRNGADRRRLKAKSVFESRLD
jgi:hypothetical protein